MKGFTGIYILIGIVIIAVLAGAAYLGKLPVKLPFSQPPTPINQPPKTTPDENADWKTYTDDKLQVSFKYPGSYSKGTVNELKNTSVYLKKDEIYTSGGGQAGSGVLKKGAVISVSLLPSKSLVEKDLKSQYGNDVKINQVTVDNKQGVEIVLPNKQANKSLYFQRDNGVTEISLSVGFENSSSENQKYVEDFNQVLSTLKFLDQNNEIANWKTYTNGKYSYMLEYPKAWVNNTPDKSDDDVLDSQCFGENSKKCILNISVLEGNSWERQKQLLGLTLSSQEGTKEVSFAGITGFKRIGLFGEDRLNYGFVHIINKNGKVYKIWAYQKTEDKSDFTSSIDQILSTFKFN